MLDYKIGKYENQRKDTRTQDRQFGKKSQKLSGKFIEKMSFSINI